MPIILRKRTPTVKLPQCSPGEGRKDDHIRFDYWRGITGGQKHSGYLAGPAKWFLCHPSDKGTKPCLHWMTKGELTCRFCGAAKMPEEGGYVPVWNAVNWAPKILFVYGDEREHVEKLELHQKLLIGREPGRGERVYVRLAMNQEPLFNTTDPRKKIARDITPSLLLMWKLPELVAWLARSNDNALSQRPAPTTSDGKPFGPMTKAAAERYGDQDAPAGGSDDVFGAAVDRAKNRMSNPRPSRNGKHET